MVGESLQHRRRVVRRHDDRERVALVGPAPRIAGGLAPERGGEVADERTGARQKHGASRARRGALEPLEEPRLGLRADSRGRPQSSGRGGAAELLCRGHVERACDLDHPFRSDAEEPPERDELRPHRVLELVELGDAARADELLDAPGDARADPTELGGPPVAGELRDGGGRRTDRLGRAAVGTGGVGARLGELEQRRERLEPLGDRVVRDGHRAG